jgi:hypothetical protein
MRKGLKSTLLTVAVALLGYQAMAGAPVISSIPDVIIGDAVAGTSSNEFVYPNALNANTLATDDSTTPGAIKWTFANSGGHYQINGRTSNFGVVNFNYENPPAAYDLDVDSDPASTDTTARTWTFRNTFYSPIGGSNTDPGANVDRQVITVFASDGTTHSSKSFNAYLNNNGPDMLSGSVGEDVYTKDFTTASDNGWVSTSYGGGSVTVLAPSANGLCLQGAALGDNIAMWQSQADYTGVNSPYSTVALVNNAVYRIRYTVQASGSLGGLTPMWTSVYDNSVFLYGSSTYYMDYGSGGVAGAEAVSPYGTRTTFDQWAVNPALKVAALNTELFTNASSIPLKNFRLQFKLLDLATNGAGGASGYGGELDYGTICMKNVVVTKYDFDAGSVSATTPITIASTGVHFNDYSGAGISTVSLVSGSLTVSPAATGSWGGTNAPYVRLDCGSAAATTNAEKYPIPWVNNQLYRLKYTLGVPSSGGGNPPDFILLGATMPTYELVSQTFLSNKFAGKAFPTTASGAQNYYTLWASNNASLAGSDYARWAPYFAVGCASAWTDTANSDGVVLTGVAVEAVSY